MVLFLVILDYVLYAIVIYLLYKNYTKYCEVVRETGKLEKSMDFNTQSNEKLREHLNELQFLLDERGKRVVQTKGEEA